MEECQEEENHEVVPKSNRFMEYIIRIHQVEINRLNEALTETQAKSKYVPNEGDRKLWKSETEIVVTQHQNNAEVKTRDYEVLEEALKEEAYVQMLAEDDLIFPGIGQNRMKMSISDDSLTTSYIQEISVRKYE